MPTEEMQMPAQGGQMPPQGMQQPSYQDFMQQMPQEQEQQTPNMTQEDTLFHCSDMELEAFNKAQGGEILEQNLGIPMFNKLWGMIQENPEVKQAIEIAMEGFFQERNPKKVSKDLNSMVRNDLQDVPQINMNNVQLSPELEQLRQMGNGQDNQLGVMPKDMLYFFWENMPGEIPMEKRVNDKTGLPQFDVGDFFSGLFSLVGGVVGTLIAPGLGTAIGMGLGNFGGQTISNLFRDEENQKGLMEILGSSALAGGLGYLGGTAWNGGLSALKDVGMVPYLVAGGGGIMSEQGKNQRNKLNYHKQESARLDDYRNKAEQHRLDEIERERKFNEDRKNAYSQFIARFRPNLHGLPQMDRPVQSLALENQNGGTLGSTFGYGE